MADPLFDVGGNQLTTAWPLEARAVTFNGCVGVAEGVTAFEADEGSLVPLVLVAVTVKV